MIASLDNVLLENVLLIGILNRLAMNYETGGLTPSSKVDNTNACSICYDENDVTEDGTWRIHPIINGLDGKSYNDMFKNVSFQVAFNCDLEHPAMPPLVTADIGDDITVIIEKGKWYV